MNECENNDACPVNSECINSIGSFQCNCPTGLIKVGHLCVIPDAHQSDWTIALDVLIGIFGEYKILFWFCSKGTLAYEVTGRV